MKADKNKKWAFSDFKKEEDLINIFGVRFEAYLLTPGPKVEWVQPDPVLVTTLERNAEMRLYSEQGLREGFIFPVLAEVFRLFKQRITLFSGVEWKAEGDNTNKDFEIGGFCDYIIGGKPRMNNPHAPMICVVEAKREDFETGTYQCAAELFVCKMNNEKAGKPYPFYFGAISNGKLWEFIKLDVKENVIVRDTESYATKNLPELLGVWQWVLETQLASAPDFKGGM